MPGPLAVNEDGIYGLTVPAQSIGRIRSGHGNFGVLVRAYTYIRALGREGLRATGEQAVISPNYLRVMLDTTFDVPYDRICMHEFVISGARQKREHGVRTLDMAKRLLDYGFHPPTVYFPLIVEEAMMIEPTETESLSSLNRFIDAMKAIAAEVEHDPAAVFAAPQSTPVRRLDEASAARNPNLRWRREQ